MHQKMLGVTCRKVRVSVILHDAVCFKPVRNVSAGLANSFVRARLPAHEEAYVSFCGEEKGARQATVNTVLALGHRLGSQ